MKYNFKKHIHSEYYSYILFFMVITFIVIYVIITLSIIIVLKNISLNILLNNAFILILSILLFIIVLIRAYFVKEFINNCFEIDAKIEKYLAYYSSNNYSRKEGTETAIRIKFKYKFNNIEYDKGVSLAKNKNTKEYFSKYKEQGNIVKILVSNRNPKNIMLLETFK